ncbi:MAG: DUF2304 family protein [Alphaproteobacteria bacterium]|jgi:hypothetical protein|nr:DUF2304 family protein [Alphaproteobacteria bacterium]MBT5860446.1 DUF2304 family protein [Alphaproteobacteria bacterium]
MMHIAIVAGLTLTLFVLVRRGLIHVDMSFPWLVAILVLGFLSTNERFVNWTAAQLGIIYEPIAIVFLTIFVLLGLLTMLLIGYSSLRRRQIQMMRHMVAQDLAMQERKLRDRKTS